MPIYVTEDIDKKAGRNVIAENQDQAQEIVDALELGLTVLGKLVHEEDLITKHDEENKD